MKNDLEAVLKRYGRGIEVHPSKDSKDELLSAFAFSVADVPKLVEEIQALRSEVAIFLDKPQDRLFHAEDRTWWKRNANGKIVEADSPPLGPGDPGWNGLILKRISPTLVLCVEAGSFEEMAHPAFVTGHSYRVVPDEEAEREGFLRVVDATGEDSLYPL